MKYLNNTQGKINVASEMEKAIADGKLNTQDRQYILKTLQSLKNKKKFRKLENFKQRQRIPDFQSQRKDVSSIKHDVHKRMLAFQTDRNMELGKTSANMLKHSQSKKLNYQSKINPENNHRYTIMFIYFSAVVYVAILIFILARYVIRKYASQKTPNIKKHEKMRYKNNRIYRGMTEMWLGITECINRWFQLGDTKRKCSVNASDEEFFNQTHNIQDVELGLLREENRINMEIEKTGQFSESRIPMENQNNKIKESFSFISTDEKLNGNYINYPSSNILCQNLTIIPYNFQELEYGIKTSISKGREQETTSISNDEIFCQNFETFSEDNKSLNSPNLSTIANLSFSDFESSADETQREWINYENVRLDLVSSQKSIAERKPERPPSTIIKNPNVYDSDSDSGNSYTTAITTISSTTTKRKAKKVSHFEKLNNLAMLYYYNSPEFLTNVTFISDPKDIHR